MLTECLAQVQRPLSLYAPCPVAADRAAWQAVPAQLRAVYAARGEALLGHAWQPLPLSAWLDFTRTGNRARYQALYFTRRRNLNDLIMAECCEYKGRYLDDILNGIWAICEESAWQLPAHNTYIRDTPQLALPDTARPIIDLFACETGAQLAMARYLLQEAFDSVDKAICARIDAELARRIITPYLSDHFWWMGGAGPVNNWTSWCTQNILITALCTPQTDAVRYKVVEQAARSLDIFLAEYGVDGCCNEGAQYYHHAGLALYGALEVLCAAAPNAFQALWQKEKIRNIAAYICNVHVSDKYFINFADCSPVAGRAGVREYQFAKRTQNEAMMAFAADDYRRSLADAPDNDDIARINLYYLAVEAFGAQAVLEHPAACVPHPELYYPSVGLFIARDNVYCLAAKAGGNADSHNHNDTGSITLYKNGKPYLIDIGVETYTQKTFSPQRYEIWTMQSAWHNLPTFDGVMQQDGAAFCARDVTTSFGAQESVICMELSGAWPAQARLSSFVRTVTLQKGRGVQVEDVCAGSYQEAVMNLLFCAKPSFDGGALQIEGLGTIQITGGGTPHIESVCVTDPRLRIAWPETLYRVQIPFTNRLGLEIE